MPMPWRSWSAALAEEASAAFDLEAGPLIRGRLIQVDRAEHVLLITMHHIVSDGWSIGVLIRELSALYRAYREDAADPLPALPIQYADYARMAALPAQPRGAAEPDRVLATDACGHCAVTRRCRPTVHVRRNKITPAARVRVELDADAHGEARAHSASAMGRRCSSRF